MWKKITEEKYELSLDSNFTLENNGANWELVNSYNGERAIVEGDLIIEVQEDAFDLLLSRFVADILNIATTTQEMLTYFDDFINKSLEINESLKPLSVIVADLKQKVLEIVLKSKTTNNIKEK